MQSRVVTVTRAVADVDGYAAAALAFLAEVDAEYQALKTMTSPAQQLKAVLA
jgi:hypothetical protein